MSDALENSGFEIIPSVYQDSEVEQMLACINASAPAQRISSARPTPIFAIRRVLKEVQEIVPVIFSTTVKKIIGEFISNHYFVTKSIYFDKPKSSNWFVSWHQDLTISVAKKTELPGFHSWIPKQDYYSVQPPLNILENTFTLRIHLDDTDENNGALRVIPGSHLEGIRRAQNMEFIQKEEKICCVPKGGVMLMSPLLFHRSARTMDGKSRRIIHIEFSNQELPSPIQWVERLNLKEIR